MTTESIREQAGRENAWERYTRLRKEGKPTGWSGFCTVPDYCTGPCDECARDAEFEMVDAQ